MARRAAATAATAARGGWATGATGEERSDGAVTLSAAAKSAATASGSNGGANAVGNRQVWPEPNPPLAKAKPSTRISLARTVAAAGGSSNLFNTTNVARLVPRQTPSETSGGSSDAVASYSLFNASNSTRAIPGKLGFVEKRALEAAKESRAMASRNDRWPKIAKKNTRITAATVVAAAATSGGSIGRSKHPTSLADEQPWPKRLATASHSAKPKHSSSSVAATGSSHLFNTSNVARAFPRKSPSEISMGGVARAPKWSAPMEGSPDEGSIPKKRKFLPPQRHEHTQSQQPQNQQPQNQQPTTAVVLLANPHLSENVNFQGRWRSRTRAPSGAGAIPLQKHTRSRIGRKGIKSAFSPKRGPNGKGDEEGSRDRESLTEEAEGAHSAAVASAVEGKNPPPSPREAGSLGLYDAESEGWSASEGTIVDQDDGSDKSVSVANDEDGSSDDSASILNEHQQRKVYNKKSENRPRANDDEGAPDDGSISKGASIARGWRSCTEENGSASEVTAADVSIVSEHRKERSWKKKSETNRI